MKNSRLHISRTHLLSSAAAVTVLFCWAPAIAQSGEEAGAKRGGDVDEIIVYGTKSRFTLQETVDSIELLDAERLENDVIFDLSEAVSRAPNTSITGDNLNLINIRGINRNGTNGAGTGSAINIFVDGVPLSPQSLNSGANPTWDIEQVEILRGSQSTVQGRNSIAGAVVVQSKNPTYDWEGAARIRFADFETRQFAAVISGPIIKDQLAFRVSADHQEREGFITDGLTGAPFDSRDNFILRGKLLVEPDAIDDLRALVTVEFNDRLNGNSTSVLAPGATPDFDPNDRITFAARNAVSDIETIRAVADISYEFTDELTLQLRGTLEDMDFFFTAEDRIDSSFGQPGAIQFINRDIYSAEARLELDFGKLSGNVGGYYYTQDLSNEFLATQAIGAAVPFPIDPIDSLIASNFTLTTDTENFAFFTSWRYEPTDKWTFDVGLRYDNEEFISARTDTTFDIIPEDCTGVVPGFLVGSPEPTTTIPCSLGAVLLLPPTEPIQTDNFAVFLPSGSITYHINDDVSVFVGARRGYRAGGTFLAQSFEAGQTFRVVVFDPEFLTTIEAGWRSQWLDDRLTVNGSAFYSNYQDQQVSITDDQGFGLTVNAGETSLYGLELSADFAATPDWKIYGSLGLLETDVEAFLFQDDDPTTENDETIDLAGNDLERSPGVSFSIGSSYEHPSGLFGSASLSYSGAYYSDIFNLGPAELGGGLTERIDPVALINARIGYRYQNYRLTGFVTNLLDEDEPESVNFAGPGILNNTGGLGTASFSLRQPRTFGVSVDVSF